MRRLEKHPIGISRRDFLKLSASAAAVSAVAGCTPKITVKESETEPSPVELIFSSKLEKELTKDEKAALSQELYNTFQKAKATHGDLYKPVKLFSASEVPSNQPEENTMGTREKGIYVNIEWYRQRSRTKERKLSELKGSGAHEAVHVIGQISPPFYKLIDDFDPNTRVVYFKGLVAYAQKRIEGRWVDIDPNNNLPISSWPLEEAFALQIEAEENQYARETSEDYLRVESLLAAIQKKHGLVPADMFQVMRTQGVPEFSEEVLPEGQEKPAKHLILTFQRLWRDQISLNEALQRLGLPVT